MASVLDHFKFSLHSELEALERELVQSVTERIAREGKSFPGDTNTVEAVVTIDLDAVMRSASSCRVVTHKEKE